jgi:endonuclease I
MRNVLIFPFVLLSLKLCGQAVQLSPASLDFGLVGYGETDSLEVSVTNLIAEPVVLEEFLFYEFYGSQPFRINQFPEFIEPFSSASFFVVYEPQHNMTHNTELVVKTSGNQGAVALDLSGSCTYSDDYYEETENLLDGDLKSALNSIVSGGYQVQGYDEARDEMYMVIDNQQVNGQGSTETRLTRAYIGTDAVGYTGRTDLFNNYDVNCEHTFPQGFYDQNLPMRSDVHHLFPTDATANSVRGNLRFGEVVSGITWSEGGSLRGLNSDGVQVFEPRDGQKGATSRALLYFLIRYENFGGFVNEGLEETLLDWHFAHLPDATDVQRNDDIEAFQNNRNPFVDYPQFARRIYSFRDDEDRPNVGQLQLSHEAIDFGAVSEPLTEFNLVLVNTGERFFTVSNATVSGSAFSLAADQPDNFVVDQGESVSLRLVFDAEPGFSEGTLTFETNLLEDAEVTLPITAEGMLSANYGEEPEVAIWPNPAADRVYYTTERTVSLPVDLIDAAGMVVGSYDPRAGWIEVASLPSGFYMLRFNLEGGEVRYAKFLRR